MQLLLATSIVLAIVAALDAARGGHWDQFAMLVALAVLAGAGLVRERARGRAVQPRADLLRWVRAQAALTDDEPTLIVDRALAAYRADLLPEREATTAER